MLSREKKLTATRVKKTPTQVILPPSACCALQPALKRCFEIKRRGAPRKKKMADTVAAKTLVGAMLRATSRACRLAVICREVCAE